MNTTDTPTPRTDAAAYVEYYAGSPEVVPADFARQLERELTRSEAELAAAKHATELSNNAYAEVKSDLDSLRIQYGEMLEMLMVYGWREKDESLQMFLHRSQADSTALRAALEKAREYIKGVNEDCPVGTDDDRDNMVEELSAALAKEGGR